MKPTKYSQVSVQALLRKLDPKAVYTALGIDSGRIQDSDDAYRTQCPFHPEASNYSLVTDKDTRSTYCLDLSCRASRLNEGGGNILEFYAMAKNIPYDTAVEEWAERLNLSLEDRSGDDVDIDRDISYFKYAEVGRYLHEEGDEGEDKGLKPLPIVVEGEEAFGRGVVVPVAQVTELSRQYTSDLYRSQFAYELTDKEAIDAERRRNALFLLGNYYIVFEAKTSAEIVHAINQAIELVERLNKDFDIPFEAINIYYSHKVIEVEVDYTVFGITPRPDLERIFAEMTRILVASEGSSNGEPGPTAFTQIKKGAYTYDYMTAVPGTKISLPGRDIFKIRLPYNLFKKTSYQRLHELSRRKPDLGERHMVDRMSQAGRAFFERAARAVEGEGKSDEHETIATLFYRDTETPELLTTANQLARTLLKRLFSENRLILRTPSEHFNRALGGGLHPGNLYMVAGFPGSGTTTFSMWLLTRIAEAYRIPCVFVSLQVGIEELFKRTLAMLGGIELSEISQKRLRPSELYSDSAFHRRTFAAYEKFVEIADNITIIEGTRVANIEHLRKLTSDLKHKTVEANGLSNVLVVIDSLQLLLAHMRAAGETEERFDLDMLTSMLKNLARELDITIYATTEYYAEHNSFYAGVDPANTDLKDLYQSTQFADTVSILSNQGTRLHNLIDYYRSSLAGTHQEQNTEELMKNLQGIEDEMRANDSRKAMHSVFCVLDMIKNRGGMTSKILFVHNRSTATFEPVEYAEEIDGI